MSPEHYHYHQQHQQYPCITEADLHELQSTVHLLRRQLLQITNEGIASNEACGVAANGIVHLRNELEEKRRERNDCLKELENVRETLRIRQAECANEEAILAAWRARAAELVRDMEEATEERRSLRRDIDERISLCEKETREIIFPMRADGQNMQIEYEQGKIRLYKLTLVRDQLHSQWKVVQAQREVLLQKVAAVENDILEAQMEFDANQTRHESLVLQLQSEKPSEDNTSTNPQRFFNLRASSESLSSIPFRSFFLRKNSQGSDHPLKTDVTASSFSTPRIVNKKDNSNHEPVLQEVEKQVQQQQQQQQQATIGEMYSCSNSAIDDYPILTAVETTQYLQKMPKIFKLGVSNNHIGNISDQPIDVNANNSTTPTEDTNNSDILIFVRNNWNDNCSIVSSLTMDETEWSENPTSIVVDEL